VVFLSVWSKNSCISSVLRLCLFSVDISFLEIPQTTRKPRHPRNTYPLGWLHPINKIIFNLKLIKAPAGRTEYVIVYELCHFVHRNHTAMDFQNKEMPAWEKWKRGGEGLGVVVNRR